MAFNESQTRDAKGKWTAGGATKESAVAADAHAEVSTISKDHDTEHFGQAQAHRSAAQEHRAQASYHRANSGTAAERIARINRDVKSRNMVEKQAADIRQTAIKAGDGRRIPGLQKSDFRKS